MRDASSRKRWAAFDGAQAPEPGSILQEIGSHLVLCLSIALIACLVFGVP